jgi:hypothetical protein
MQLGYKESEVDVRALGSAGLNFAASNTSSQRLHMDTSHLKQHLTLIDGDAKRWFTGVEREYAKRAYKAEFPVDCMRVFEVITKYSGMIPSDMDSPLTLVVYERRDDHKIAVLELASSRCEHQTFGFTYKRTKEGRGVLKHKAFKAGTILAKPPTITDDGDYKYGKELKTFVGNTSAGVEDGAWISDEAAYMLRTDAFGELDMTLDKGHVLLNMNGNERHFKGIPDIGDYLRDDGLVMACRELHKDFPMQLYNKHALREHSQLDNLRYGEPFVDTAQYIGFELPPGEELLLRPRVIDIEVIKGGSNKTPITKSEEQLNKYWEKTVRFHEAIRKTHEDLERLIPNYELDPSWQRYVDDAYFYTTQPHGTRSETLKNKPLPQWSIKVKYRYTFVPTIGAKITNIHAGKTVIVKKTPRHMMPKDADGNYADVVVEDISIANRMNPGVAFEGRLGSCELATRKRIKEMWDAKVPFDEIYDYYVGFVKIVSPMSYHELLNPSIDRELELKEVMEGGIYAYVPPSLGAYMIDILAELTAKYPPCRERLELTTNDGRKILTDEKAEIVVLHYQFTERAGNSFSAVSSAKRQPFGIPTKASQLDKNSFPTKISSTRFPSEADTKSIQSHINNEGIPELMDRSLNPVSHWFLLRSLIRSVNPAKIKDAVSRKIIPRIGNRIIAIRDTMLLIAGIKFKEGRDGNSVLPEDEVE